MASYQQTGKKTCTQCKQECTTLTCPSCGGTAKPSGKWSVRFYAIENGINTLKRLSGFERKKDAEAAYREFMITYEPSEKPQEMTFGQLFELYKINAETELKTSSYVSNESKIRLYILPYFKDLVVNEITPKIILNWKRELEQQNLAHKYRTNIYYGLSAVLRFGNNIYDLNNHSLKKVGNFANKEIPREMEFWTEEEFKTFLAVVDTLEYRCLFLLLYLSGCRRGEALALTWKDYRGNGININKSVTYKSKNNLGYEITTPKNKTSIRNVEIPDVLCQLLNELQSKSKGKYIFGGDHPIPKTRLQRAFETYTAKAGVKKIRLHDIRHSHASLLFNKGMDILQIAKRLGHSDVRQLLNTYAHLLPSRQEELLKSININLDNLRLNYD